MAEQGYNISMTVDVGDKVSGKVAEAWAVGQRNGVDVGETDRTYHNNAKYYAQLTADAMDAAVLAVTNARDQGVTAVGNAKTEAVSTVNATKDTGVSAVNAAKEAAISAVNGTGAAIIAALPDEYETYSDLIKLSMDNVPGTTEKVIYNEDGSVKQIEHQAGGVAARTDTFTIGDTSVTERRVLAAGGSLTMVTDLETLETTVTYAAS